MILDFDSDLLDWRLILLRYLHTCTLLCLCNYGVYVARAADKRVIIYDSYDNSVELVAAIVIQLQLRRFPLRKKIYDFGSF